MSRLHVRVGMLPAPGQWNHVIDLEIGRCDEFAADAADAGGAVIDCPRVDWLHECSADRSTTREHPGAIASAPLFTRVITRPRRSAFLGLLIPATRHPVLLGVRTLTLDTRCVQPLAVACVMRTA